MKDYRNLTVQKYYDNPSPASSNLEKKKEDIINNVGDLYIASMKWDGEWFMMVKDEHGIFFRGRNLNVKKVYEDKSPKVPHLVEEFDRNFPVGTVLIGEICFGDVAKGANQVGSILRCLPATAISRQKEEHQKLRIKVFDLLQYDGENYDDKGYEERLLKAIEIVKHAEGKYIGMTTICNYDCPEMSFKEFALDIIKRGGEGAVLVSKNMPYEYGKRTSWKTLKIKQIMEVMELTVVGTLEPNKNYGGTEAETWDYAIEEKYENGHRQYIRHIPIGDRSEVENMRTLVTKPYYMGWKGVIRVEYKDTIVDVHSGLSDADKEWLATEEAQEYIKQGRLIANVSAMMEAAQGSLRHPTVKGLRVID